MTDYSEDARARHDFIGQLGRAADGSDAVVELTDEQRRLLAPLFARLPEDGTGVMFGQVFDGGYQDELAGDRSPGGPRVFVFVRLLTGGVARELHEATRRIVGQVATHVPIDPR